MTSSPPSPRLDAATANGSAHADRERTRVGLLFAFGAYAYWAVVFPLHVRGLDLSVPAGMIDTTAERFAFATEILGHRIVWSLALCIGLLFWLGRWGDLRALLTRKRSLAALGLTAALITVNWLLFIYAVTSDQLYRASIGYFVTPLVNVLLGMLFLSERLRRWQWLSVGAAACGIGWLFLIGGSLPWIELSLAFSFGFYGLLRKRVDAGPVVGLTVETALLLPLALGYLVWLMAMSDRASGFATGGADATALFVALGVSTALPLLWFAAAAKRLRLVTIGFIQFSAPTGQFLLSVVAFGNRPPNPLMWWGYAMIWTGVVIFVLELLTHANTQRKLKKRSIVTGTGEP